MIFFKKFVILFIINLFIFLPFSNVYAESAGLAPLNPEFIEYQRNLQYDSINVEKTRDGRSLGEIPSPADHDFTEIKYRDKGIDSFAYPLSYDLRTYNKVSPVRDQGSCGSCWTFAAMATAESFGRPANSWDFSEQAMNAYHGFDPEECNGGNDDIATAYLSRWDGFVNESDKPYPYPDNFSINQTSSDSASKFVQEVIKIPARTGFTDNDYIKYFVMTNGAVFVSFNYNSAYISANDESFYNNTDTSTNHAVAVIGWNDNYPSTNFKPGTQPPGNGAFLIRNSWGTSKHGDGYFWLSYYDTSFKPRVSYSRVEAKGNYKSLYQYDPLGYVGRIGFDGQTTGWGANIFTADSNEKISAVGFHTTDTSVVYAIYVYTNVTTGQPTSGTLAATVPGTETYAGYYTVDLPSPVSVNKGTNFSIVIQLVQPNRDVAPLAVEYIWPGYSSNAKSHANESFYSPDGTSWADYYTTPTLASYQMNNCIKAFTESTYNYYIPVFKHPSAYLSGLATTNLSSTSSATVSVAIYNQSGALLDTETKVIAANGQDSFTVGASLTSNGWIKVTSTEELAGLSFLGEYNGATANLYVTDVPFVQNLSELMVLPHVFQNTNWGTTLYLANPNTSAASVTLTYTNKAGTSSAPYTTTIPVNGSEEISVATIGNSTNIIDGYVTISSTTGLTAFAIYQNLETNVFSFAGVNAVDISE